MALPVRHKDFFDYITVAGIFELLNEASRKTIKIKKLPQTCHFSMIYFSIMLKIKFVTGFLFHSMFNPLRT